MQKRNGQYASLHEMVIVMCAAFSAAPSATAAAPADDRYTPRPGGWAIHLHDASAYANIRNVGRASGTSGPAAGASAIDPVTGCLTPAAPLGFLRDNPRNHRRPLYPPADKSMIWTEAERARTPTVTFRPLILAYNAPRFLFDYHSAGGLLGHLRLGLVQAGGGKWFHEWSEIDVRYVDGRLEYTLSDPAFAGTTVRLVAAALADTAGLIVKVEVTGSGDGTLVWAYGGASAFFTNWNMLAKAFRFSAEQCAKDVYTLDDGTFELVRAFDEADGIVGGEGRSLCVMKFLPGWKAHVKGGSSWRDAMGFVSPEAFTRSPDALPAEMDRRDGKTGRTAANCLVAERVSLVDGKAAGYIVVGMGGKIDACLAAPERAYRAALARNEGIANRIVTRTPDPYLDAAMRMMAFATDGTWASEAYVHGGWSWRFAYLGWRILYGPTCYGWTDRVGKNIRTHCRLGRIEAGPDAGGLSSMLESKGFFYNMNEVFFDMVRHYFDYTDDRKLMKEIFPVLTGMLARENRRLRPGPAPLYENALNTWISDAHWYIGGQCTQSSAYMLRAYTFMADVARRLGKDEGPYRKAATRIRAAMQRVLWQPRKGVFAEYRDTRGHGLLHGEPELPTIYHAAEFGAADPLQIDQMLYWADTHLRQERTPEGGRLYWSSNWFPNHGRSYTHSTYELAYGETLNFAETQYLAGRSDVGYSLLRAVLSGIFNGPTPGGLSCHTFVDGTQRANDAFADAISMWGRAVTEGLFGIHVKRPDALVKLTPQLPRDWPEASIRTPHFSYRYRAHEGAVEIDWASPIRTAVALRLPIRASRVQRVETDGHEIPYRLEKGVGLTWLAATTRQGTKGKIKVSFTPDEPRIPGSTSVRPGQAASFSLPGVAIAEWVDPQGLLADPKIEQGRLVGTVNPGSGPGLLFVSQGPRACPRWIPVAIEVEPEETARPRRWSAPDVPDRDLGRWRLVDLAAVYNANVPEVPRRVREGAIPPDPPASQVGFRYWAEHLTVRSQPPCDERWRAKIGGDGVAWAVDGIPFQTSRKGADIAVVCLHNKAFPAKTSFLVGAQGRVLYLMVSGMTHPNQSHVVNLRVTLRYADGTAEAHDLVNPFDIGDCWSTWCGVYFDTPANGFENIGGRKGPAGSAKVTDSTQPVAVDTIAHLIPFTLRPGVQLATVDVEAIANDVVFGVMGASVLRSRPCARVRPRQ